jgi:uncharacterized protein
MARWTFHAAAALVALSAALPALADVKDGVDAWSRGDFARAVKEWQKPAAEGDADAQFNLAQAYKLGKGVPVDLKKAEELYLKAAQQGHLQAADAYGLVLFQTGRRDGAMGWLAASAERGEPRAQYVLGTAHFNGDFVAKDPVRAYALMTLAASSGLDVARTSLAAMDQAIPLEQRQHGIALAAQLERQAGARRAAQMASLGLGAKTASPPPRMVPERVTAGADFANPVVLGATVKPAAPSPPPRVLVSRPAIAAVAAIGAWRVQLGAFGVAGNAQALWAKLKGQPALARRQAFYVPAGKLTRLLAGPFATRAEAQATCARLGAQACLPVD